MALPKTLGELKQQGYRVRPVKDEMRANLLDKLRRGERIFPGIVGYDETVIPQITNAVLARHNVILLGLRGQAKSRIIRQLVGLLDERVPVIAGSEINDDPFRPISAYGRQTVEREGEHTPIAWVERDARFVEKLATPDVTIADIIGDVDPIKAAKGGHLLSDELTIHYGLLPRANRGLFAINELPDLAGKIQVGLFNIMQEGDVQIKGYPLRLPLEEGISITEQEAWLHRDGLELHVPKYVREVVERVAFLAREDKKIDKRSGVSQRLPISVMENVVSNAERRALRNQEKTIVPRIGDIYAALPSI